MAQADSDGGGEVDFREFCGIFLANEDLDAQAERMFRMFDTDHSGFLSLQAPSDP
jgi:Ca2+-binding EF-hand superfamily protein